MVILKNKTRQMKVYNLDAPFFVRNQNETKWGQPCAVTFLALEEKELHDAVLACAEIEEAMRKGDLRLLSQTVEKKEEPPKVMAAPSKKSTKKSSK